MPKGYLIVRVEVSDPEGYKRYVEESTHAVQKFGGRFLVRGGKHEVMEGQGMSRNVILEFKDADTARAYYNSPEYQSARAHRIGGADFNMTLVEGFE